MTHCDINHVTCDSAFLQLYRCNNNLSILRHKVALNMATDCECLQTWSTSLKHQDGKLHTVAIILVSVRCPTTVSSGVTEAQQKHTHTQHLHAVYD